MGIKKGAIHMKTNNMVANRNNNCCCCQTVYMNTVYFSYV